MTLHSNIHSWSDELQLWFEAVVSGLQFSILTLNVCRTARQTLTVSVRQQEDTLIVQAKSGRVEKRTQRSSVAKPRLPQDPRRML